MGSSGPVKTPADLTGSSTAGMGVPELLPVEVRKLDLHLSPDRVVSYLIQSGPGHFLQPRHSLKRARKLRIMAAFPEIGAITVFLKGHLVSATQLPSLPNSEPGIRKDPESF